MVTSMAPAGPGPRTAASGILALSLLFGGGTAQAQEPAPVEITSIDPAGHPTVTAVVAAPTGLAGVAYPPGAFQVLEDGKPVDATTERIPTSNLEIILVFDTSGSMVGEPLAAARDAANGFLDVLPPEVRVGIVAFGPASSLLAAPTSDRDALAAEVADLTAAGETALYDAVVHATSQFSPGASNRAVVLLSDGGDTASEASLAEAVTAAAGATVNVIELVTPESNRSALDRLATAGGGSVSSASDPGALADLYRATAQTLVNRYRITYTSSGHGVVTLTVRLTTDEGVREDTEDVELPAPPDASSPATEPRHGDPESAATGRRSSARPPLAEVGLAVGAGAIFLALLILGLVFLPPDPRARLAAARLGAAHAVAEAPGLSQVTQRLAAAAERFLERRGRGQNLATALDVAGISLRTGEYVVLALAAAVVAALGGLVLAGPLGLVVALAIALAGAWALVNGRAERRRARFAELLPENLQLLTSTLRSGYGLLQALDTLGREAAEPGRTEFRRVLFEIRVGRDPGAALRALADRMRSEDFEWVVAAIDIHREVGGDLAMILDNVAETIRERQRLQRQTRTLTAEGRMSAYVLTALPLVLALALAVINPAYLARLGSGAGLVLVGIAAALLVVGWIWMRRLTRLTF
jgi:tight adherence protein B